MRGVDRLALPDRGSAFAHAPLGVALCTETGEVIDANVALGRLLGRGIDELVGHSLFDSVHPDDLAGAEEAYGVLRSRPGLPMRYECRMQRADGGAVPVQIATSWVEESPATGPGHLVVILEDITERKQLEAQLVHRSMHDPLTGLPNRILFHDRLRHALERGHRERTPTCVLIIDLDGFKAINDLYGHPIGDMVLVAFAERLTSVLRASDTAARLGGDEFSIVCENTERADADILADRLRRTVTEPLELDGTTVSLGMSVGIGLAPGGDDPEAAYDRVVREADDAMYADKTHRR